MTKKRIIIAAAMAVVAVTLALGFASIMMRQAQVWAAQRRPLSDLVRCAVNTASFIDRNKPAVTILLAAGSAGLVWVIGALFQKHEHVA